MKSNCFCKKRNKPDSNKDNKLNTKLSLDEVKKLLWLKYGICIELKSLHEVNGEYDINKKYTFYRTDALHKHTKEFVCYLRDILYRNYYWINTNYKMNSLYDNIKRDIKKGNFVKNKKKFKIIIHMNDGYDIFFYPDYVNMETKSCLHIFDMSWFTTCDKETSKREYMCKVLDYFDKSTEWSLDYYCPMTYDTDFD